MERNDVQSKSNICDAPIKDPQESPTRSGNWLSALLKLPSEVLLEVFYQLDISELLNLRASNHIVHALLYKHEAAIVRNYFRHKLPPHCLARSSNARAANAWTFDNLCEIVRRQRTCERLSVIVSNGISERLRTPLSVVMAIHRRYTRSGSVSNDALDPRLEKRCAEIRPRLVTALFILDDFFHWFKVATLDCVRDLQGVMSDIEFSSLTQCLNWDQQLVIERYPENLMIEAHHVFRILSHVVSHHLNGDLKYADAVRTTFVMGGLDAVEKALRPGGLRKRMSGFQNAFIQAMTGTLPPHKLAKAIQHFPSAYKTSPIRDGITRSNESIVRFICSQSVWTPSALAVMQRRDVEDPWKGNMYRYIDSILKQNNALGDIRVVLRPWDNQVLI